MIVDLCNLAVKSDAERAADWDLSLRVRGVDLAVRPQTFAGLLELQQSKAKSLEETRMLVDSILFAPSPVPLGEDEIMAVIAAVIVYAQELLVKKKQEETIAAVSQRVRVAMADCGRPSPR